MLELRRGGGTLSDRLRLRAIASIDGGPRGVLPLTSAAALFTGAVGLLVILLGSAPGRQPTTNRLAEGCLAGLALAGLAGLAAHRLRPRPGAPAESPEGHRLLTGVMLAAAALLPLLLLPVHYMAARTHPTTLKWNGYGFLDKRWITTSFLLLTIGAALLLAVADRVAAVARRHPQSWRDWARQVLGTDDDPSEDARPASLRWVVVAAKLACALVVATYFFGPPWHLPARGLNYHETNTLGGVQAIRTGSLPYIDAAAVQYGPGAQVANDLYAQATGHLSVDGFREAALLFNWIAATIFLGALYLRVRPVVAAVTTVAAITLFPALQIFGVLGNGVMYGFWGWGNTLRYAGVFLLAMCFPAVVARSRGRRPPLAAVASGAAWGLLCLVAQENLIGGAMVLGFLSVLLLVTQTAARRALLASLLGVAAGFVLVVVPVLAVYAAHGRLGRFLELYWLVPQAVASGYSNTVFRTHNAAGWEPLFYGLPVLLTVLLMAALLTSRPLGIATRWSQQRVVLVSALVAAVVCHLGALTRSDKAHLANTQLALPAALCLAAFYLPGLLGATSRRWRWGGGLAIAAVVIALLPLSTSVSRPTLVAAKLWQPLHARIDPPAPRRRPAGIPSSSIAAARMGPATLSAKQCCTRRPVPMAAFVRFMDRLHAVVGARRVYVDGVSHRTVVPPAVYFLADLRPAPTRQEAHTMVLNNRIRAQWYQFFRAHLQDVRAIVTLDIRGRAPALWAAAFPRHRTVTIPLGPNRVHVLLR